METTPELWQRVTAAFEKAIDLPEAERKAFVAAITDTDVARELVSLLPFHDSDNRDFLEVPIGPKVAQALVDKAVPSFRDGDKVGDFVILGLIGQGSFAKVYLAHQVSLGRQVALKVSANVGVEAQTMANLEHDNIVTVYSESVDEAAGLRMICMQYVPGCTLEAVLSAAKVSQLPLNGENLLTLVDSCSSAPTILNPAALKDRQTLAPLDPLDTVAWFGIRLADALEYAHKRGVLHLDIKPGNILVTPYGRPLLTDFNVSLDEAAAASGEARLLGGTLNYMSPEQTRAFERGGEECAEVGARSDIYSLGVVLRELASEVLGESDSIALQRILDRCTAPEATDRYASAAELSRDLAGTLEQRNVLAELPAAGPLIRYALLSPMWAMSWAVLFAQLVASAVNIAYNQSRIISYLTLDQQEFFQFLCLVWNPFIFSTSIIALIWLQLPLYRFSVSPQTVAAGGPQALARLRKRILQYPVWLVGIATVGWSIGSVLFPGLLDIFRGPVPAWIYGHFLISFALSWLIAITYSFLLSEYIGVRVLYPRAWIGCSNIRETARRELRWVGRRMSVFHCLAGFVPLIGALGLIATEPAGMDAKDYDFYRLLLVLLIGTGMLGFLFSLNASGRLARTLYALTGIDRHHK